MSRLSPEQRRLVCLQATHGLPFVDRVGTSNEDVGLVQHLDWEMEQARPDGHLCRLAQRIYRRWQGAIDEQCRQGSPQWFREEAEMIEEACNAEAL